MSVMAHVLGSGLLHEFCGTGFSSLALLSAIHRSAREVAPTHWCRSNLQMAVRWILEVAGRDYEREQGREADKKYSAESWPYLFF